MQLAAMLFGLLEPASSGHSGNCSCCCFVLVGRLGLQVRNIDVAKINYLPAVKASIFDTSIISHCITDLSGAQVLIQT